MRTPVVLVTGQGDSDRVAGTLMGIPGTLVVGHEYDGQVVRRWPNLRASVAVFRFERR